MERSIRTQCEQFGYKPEIVNGHSLTKRDKFIVVGMGGSALSAGLLKTAMPNLDLIIHRSYGLPSVPGVELKDRLFIASSYSGNTEETLDALDAAIKSGMDCAAVTTGGTLLKIAEDRGLPYIQLPDLGLQPRMALGLSLNALLKLMGLEEESAKLPDLCKLDSGNLDVAGKALAEKLAGSIPVVYASHHNISVAYAWKVKLNETGKTPAFYNFFPELNHNEMTGFDGEGAAKELASKFHFIFLRDKDDNPKIKRRMEVMEDILREKGLKYDVLDIDGTNEFEKIFSSLMLADWASYYLAYKYGSDPEAVPLVEKFKKML